MILDVEMPEFDGIQTLRILRQRAPHLPVIMFSALTERAGEITLDALTLGAADYVTKPTSLGNAHASVEKVRAELLEKIHVLMAARPGGAAPAPSLPPPPSIAVQHGARVAPRIGSHAPVELVVIGASTGGPTALEQLLIELSADFPVPIVVVQHMPALFTRLFAQRLEGHTALRVREVEDGTRPRAGEIWIAPGDWHSIVERDRAGLILRLGRGEPENFCRPAVDVLFRSAATCVGPGTLGIVLTGMGCDGLAGCQAIREADGRVVVQDEVSSLIWGMPGAIARAGLADEIASLGDMPLVLFRHVAHAAERSRPGLLGAPGS